MIGVVVYGVGCARAGPAGQAGGAWPLVPVAGRWWSWCVARHGWSRGAAH